MIGSRVDDHVDVLPRQKVTKITGDFRDLAVLGKFHRSLGRLLGVDVANGDHITVMGGVAGIRLTHATAPH